MVVLLLSMQLILPFALSHRQGDGMRLNLLRLQFELSQPEPDSVGSSWITWHLVLM